METPVNEGLQNVIVAKTEVSMVDGEKGRLVFRGQLAKTLSQTKSFEEVAYLIWYGCLPGHDELRSFREKLLEERDLPDDIQALIDAIPAEAGMMSAVRTTVSALESPKYAYPPTIEQAISVTMKLPAIIAYRLHRLRGSSPVKSKPELGHAAHFLYLLKGEPASEAQVKTLETYLILMMEHGMNSSTFAARVIASTRSDIISSITGAIGALKGPLHGGAPRLVMDMLKEIGSKERAEDWIREKLANGERLAGFGHRIYKTTDPRSEALREVASELSANDPSLDLAVVVEETAIRLLKEYKPDQKLYTNVEFYAAAVMNALAMEEELFTPTFAVARAVGWCSHIIEASKARLVYPDSLYTGQLPPDCD